MTTSWDLSSRCRGGLFSLRSGRKLAWFWGAGERRKAGIHKRNKQGALCALWGGACLYTSQAPGRLLLALSLLCRCPRVSCALCHIEVWGPAALLYSCSLYSFGQRNRHLMQSRNPQGVWVMEDNLQISFSIFS